MRIHAHPRFVPSARVIGRRGGPSGPASRLVLADDILIGDTDWSRYLPWYQTRVVAEYHLAAAATRME